MTRLFEPLQPGSSAIYGGEDVTASENFPHDAAYKTFFSNPEMVKSLLLDFIPEDFIRDFDFNTLEACTGSYTAPEFQQRQDDIVWRLKIKNIWCYIYILLEFQSTQDYWMALRISIYTALLWQELIKQGEIKTGDKLPPVLPIVIYNGEKPWTAAENTQELVGFFHSDLSRYQIEQKYFLLDENRISQLLLDEATGEAGYIFRLERARDTASILKIYHEFMSRLSDERFDFLRRSIRTWLGKLVKKKNLIITDSADNGEDNVMLEEKFRRWEQEFYQNGVLAGKAEGVAQQKNTLLEMLSDRFESVPASWRNIINGLSDPVMISQLTRQIYKVSTAEEFGNLLSKPTVQ